VSPVAKLKESLKDAALWIYWHPFRRLVQKLGPGPAYVVGSALGRFAFHFCKGKRQRMERELDSIVFEGGLPEERARILLEAFQTRFWNEMEVLLFPALNPALAKELVPAEGLGHLDQALARGKGALLLFAHFGANQMVMPAIGHRGYRMCQLGAPPTVWPEKMPGRKFSSMARRALELRWEHECSLPVKHISVFGSLKPVFRCLKENGVLGIAADGGGGAARVAVPLFGRRALLSTGAMEIAARTGCAVLPVFMIRDRRGRSTMLIEPPLDIDISGGENAVSKNMSRFALRLGYHVRRHPGHYLDFMALRRFMESLGDPPFLLDSENGEQEEAARPADVPAAVPHRN